MDVKAEPTSYELAILRGLQRNPNVYGGLTDAGWARVDRRRAKNKVARKQRKHNRRHA